MNTSVRKPTWEDANQAYLVAEFALLKHRLRPQSDAPSTGAKESLQAVVEARATMEELPAIDHLSSLFDLSPFERDILLLCAGVEMDSKLAAQCAELHGRPQQTYVTFGLAMAALPEPQWSALTTVRPLRRFRLLEVEAGRALTSAALRIDERVLHYLAGVNLLDSRLESFIQVSAFPNWIAAEHHLTATQAALVVEGQRYSPLIHLCGDDALGQEDVATLTAYESDRHLFVVRVEDLPPVGPDLDQLAVLWQRESLLVPGALLIQSEPAGFTAAARHLAERLHGLVFLAGKDPVRLSRPFLRFEVNKPQPTEQKRLWQQALGPAAATFNGTLDDLSEQFRLSARMIFSTGGVMASRKDQVSPQDLWNACRSLARPKLEELAQRIVPCTSWDDLVLPEMQKEVLHQLAAQVRHRMLVYETWGFSAKGSRGLGVSALFTGESGTGKTMAAEVLANELGLDLYRIDLSAVVSKYIGETEKNLKQVFDAADEGGVLLLFDEADALFGKRSEVRDSRDRYANIEVGYLLQRMEAYQGLAILTTNLKSSLDKSFQRRLRFTVNFPFPDANQREAIWKQVFPAATPTYELDAKKLSRLNVTGGNIRNIALNATFLAATAGTSVEMKHLVDAARLEAQKIERSLSEAEIRGWA